MVNFTECPVIDNHCHDPNPERENLEPIGFVRLFAMGMADIPTPGVASAKQWGATDELLVHFRHKGVVLTAVCQLAKFFDCEPDLEAVVAERNRRIKKLGFSNYAKMLYKDARIVCTVMESPRPINDPILGLFPGKQLRILQTDPLLRKLIPGSGSYAELLRRFQADVEKSIRQDGFVGVKFHLGERVGFDAAPVEADEAERHCAAAVAGDGEAYKKIYMAVVLATMLQAQELKFPVHFHTGYTSFRTGDTVAGANPLLFTPILRQPRFLQTRVVFLHGGYPWILNAAMMAHIFPHVWVDMSITTPLVAQRIVECYRDAIGETPLSKLMFGSGGHSTPEISWLAARTAKIALGEILSDAVRLGLMAERDAEKTGRMILHDNAARLYGMMS